MKLCICFSSSSNVQHLEKSLMQKQRGEAVVMISVQLAVFMDSDDEA